MDLKKRILIVDDNQSVHEDIRQILAGSGKESAPWLADMEKELFGSPAHDIAAAIKGQDQYRIDDAMQGEHAVAMAEKAMQDGDPYALIFMDVRMPPGIDGIQTIKKMWEKKIPAEIVICTAYSDYAWEEIILQLGVSDKLLFLRKPFDAVGVKQTALALTAKWELNRRVESHVADLELKIAERTRDLNTLLAEKENYIQLIQEDLALASTVQSHLLPAQLPQFDMIEVAAQYFPASKVGGDYYDVTQLDPKHVAFLILDVSGHGLAAALITAMVKYMYRAKIQTESSPAAIFDHLNKELSTGTPDIMFATAFLIVINTETLEAVFCNAGHPGPLHFSARTGNLRELSSTGMILGLSDDWVYEETRVQFELDDKILLYTDGIIEAFNPEGKLFGRKRLMDTVLAHAKAGPADLLNQITLSHNKFTDNVPVRDDVCLVGLQIMKSRFAKIIQEVIGNSESVSSFSFIKLHREPDIDRVSSFIMRDLDRNGYSDKTIKGMRLAITEVLLNAVHHGNQGDETKSIALAFHINTARVIIGVMDEGKGFDYHKLDLPVDPENIRGRGIFITKHYVDSLTYHGTGNCVVLICHRKGSTQEKN